MTVYTSYVLPFMRSSGYTFSPLRDKGQVAEKAYHVRDEPTNFLIDRDGQPSACWSS